ncbi:ribose-phosphate pyrophosphokinase 5 [Podospora australis]|uniref:Ribose-phosphate pyrophosphokinase 5 n=1 Tax=Podospora australis TaxID=1536484 RepID=A0AAN6X5A6_9PEZI|nr:ribose-phosphate pyrophosphokinase 5 [Podospora australis]
MVRNISILSGDSHPKFVDAICESLGVPPADRILGKFSSGESRCEIRDSVRGKDVYIVQTFGVGTGANKVNDYLIELCIMISACKTGSAKRVTAVLPLFPYSRQPDLPFSKAGAPLVSNNSTTGSERLGTGTGAGEKVAAAVARYTFESVPATPGPSIPRTAGLSNGFDINDALGRAEAQLAVRVGGAETPPLQMISLGGNSGFGSPVQPQHQQQHGTYTTHDYENPTLMMSLHTKPGYKQWMAQSGSLVADLLTCAGADRILTCDLHESTYQGFFDIPVDNLFARSLLKRYIQHRIPDYHNTVIVSPDAGGAKRASAIADGLGLAFALIHKERRPPKFTTSPAANKATMMLVGTVANRVCLLIDDLADTANTITRAAKLLKREGATKVITLLTHGIFSGDAIARINASALDKVVVTNTVAQEEHCAACPKLEVLDISGTFAEAIRRVHHGESISVLFQYDQF